MKEEMTMTMIRKSILLFAAFLLPALKAIPQEKDFGLWFELEAEKKISRMFDLSIAGGIRTFENASRIDVIFLEPSLSVKFNDYVSATAAYKLSNKLEDDGEFYYRHRLSADATLSYPGRNWKVSGRFRIQRTTRTFIEDSEDLAAEYVGRFRLKASYDFSSKPFAPFVYFEAYNPLFEDKRIDIQRIRISAGTQVRISNSASFEAGYILQRDYKSVIHDMHIISASLKVKF